MKKEYDAYLAVTLNGDDIEIQVDGHAGDIAQIAAMALTDVIVQSSPGMDSMMEKIVADAMKQAKENPGQAQGVMFKVPAGDMPMEEVVKHIISAVDKQARKDQNGG